MSRRKSVITALSQYLEFYDLGSIEITREAVEDIKNICEELLFNYEMLDHEQSIKERQEGQQGTDGVSNAGRN